MNKLTIILVLVLIVLATGFAGLYINERNERMRLDKNQSSLLSGIEFYKTQYGIAGATVKKLTLTAGELREHESILIDSLKKQGYKINRLESITQINTKTEIKFVPEYIEREVRVNDTIIKRIPCYEYSDKWVQFWGCKDLDGTPVVNISQNDSLGIVGTRVPKFLWFGVKSVNLDIRSYNPYTKITYVRNIELKRK